MSDGSLSQEEIDALLQGADDLGSIVEEPAPEPAPAQAGLTDDEKNEFLALSREMAQTMGTTLSTITGKQVTIKNPQIDILTRDQLSAQLSGKPVQINADFSEGAAGRHFYLIPEDLGKHIAAMMMAQEEGELTEMALSALNEGFSQMTGASSTIIEDKTGITAKTSGITATQKESPQAVDAPKGSFVRVRYEFETDGTSSTIDEIFDLNIAKSLADSILTRKGISIQQAPPPRSQPFTAGIQEATAFGGGPAAQGNVGVQPVQFAPLSGTERSEVSGNIGLLMDVSMQLTVELGRTKMLIKDILGMGEGTIVELDKLAGEPVDLLVNGKLIAKGEVVVIDENFGVRVTDIISPMERISNLE